MYGLATAQQMRFVKLADIAYLLNWSVFIKDVDTYTLQENVSKQCS